MSVIDLADVRFLRAVERLHDLGPRALIEFLAELGAQHLLRTEIERLVAHHAQIDDNTLVAIGGERVLAPPLHLITDKLDAALRYLRETESSVGGDPGVLLHQLNMVGLAIEDARDLRSGQGHAS